MTQILPWKYDESRNNIHGGKRTSELVLVERSLTSGQKAGCAFDVESNREERDQFRWMSVQEVVTGGEQD